MSLEDLEDMAVKVLYVRFDLRDSQQQQEEKQQQQEQQQEKQKEKQQQQKKKQLTFESAESLDYIAKDGTKITVPATLRWQCTEFLFRSVPPSEMAADVGESLVELVIRYGSAAAVAAAAAAAVEKQPGCSLDWLLTAKSSAHTCVAASAASGSAEDLTAAAARCAAALLKLGV
ncbi:actin, putative [Eimeria tenella]|uniref:Actin, putative n=1 Tax=Eimeria tenella TaxID=5802 RepID=U6L2K6_EIMTE|nr:actin, putative [Eimeria tenella]CDJ44632.1 actin, putative [Eimeria tenella]|eukprot:XP_013235380.1 actin, putative [Eimeria tenella]